MAQQWYTITADGVYGQRQYFAGDEIPMEWAVEWGLPGAALTAPEVLSDTLKAAIAAELADPTSAIRAQVEAAILDAGGIGGAGGGPPVGYGAYDATSVYSATASTSAVSADTLYAVPLYLTNGATLGSFRLYVTASSSGNARVGLYAAGTDGEDPATFRKPTTLITDAGQQSTGSTGSKYWSLDPAVALDAGLYFMVVVFSGTPTVQALTATSCGWDMQVAVNPATYRSGITEAFTYAALPATFPGFLSPVSTALPQISATLSAPA